VDEPEAEADEPAPRHDRPEEEVLGRDGGDRQGDDRLHEPVRQRHEGERGEREGDAVGQREGGDDLGEREPAAARRRSISRKSRWSQPGSNNVAATRRPFSVFI